MKRILVLDGGGAKGVIQSAILQELEIRSGKKCSEMFDLIVGTSIGAILGAGLASGKMSGKELHEHMRIVLPKVFKKRLFAVPKYSRKEFTRFFEETLGRDFLMGACATPFICTSVNMVDGKTHYFKSWEDKDSQLSLYDAVLRSFAAPLFFGSIIDKKNKAVWLDGGTGNANSPILEAVVETTRQGWLQNEPVQMLNIGTGWSKYSHSFEKARKFKTLRQLGFYMDPSAGGLARNQSVHSRVSQIKSLSEMIPNFSYQRLDWEIDEDMDVLDGIKFIDEYEKIGLQLARVINTETFVV